MNTIMVLCVMALLDINIIQIILSDKQYKKVNEKIAELEKKIKKNEGGNYENKN